MIKIRVLILFEKKKVLCSSRKKGGDTMHMK